MISFFTVVFATRLIKFKATAELDTVVFSRLVTAVTFVSAVTHIF